MPKIAIRTRPATVLWPEGHAVLVLVNDDGTEVDVTDVQLMGATDA
jgi:hypothetical protein